MDRKAGEVTEGQRDAEGMRSNAARAAFELRAVVANCLNEAPSLVQRNQQPEGEARWATDLPLPGDVAARLSIGEMTGILDILLKAEGEDEVAYQVGPSPGFRVSVSENTRRVDDYEGEVPSASEIRMLMGLIAEGLAKRKAERTLGCRVLDAWHSRNRPWMAIGGRVDWQRQVRRDWH